MDKQFIEIAGFIQQVKQLAINAVNKELINLYWNVGAYIADKLTMAQWGDKTIDELADFIQKEYQDLKGFIRRDLYRMCQFFETYRETAFESSTMTQIQTTENQPDIIVPSMVVQFQDRDIRQHRKP